MLTLGDAIRIVDERRRAVLGEPEASDEPVTLQFAATVEQDQAILSGYDVDHDEVVQYVSGMAEFYSQLALNNSLVLVLRCAIADAFQVGLVKGADSQKS